MSIYYKIHPELPIMIYVCAGMITASEFFAVEDQAALDKDYRDGLITIIDLRTAGVSFELQDMYHVINWTNNLEKQKIHYGETALLTNDKGINISVTAINLMAGHTRLKLHAFSLLESAIVSLDLSAYQEEIFHLWRECCSMKELYRNLDDRTLISSDNYSK